MVQRPQAREQTSRTRSDDQQNASPSSASIDQSVYASVTQVAAFGTAQAREQEQEQDQQVRRAPRLVQPRTPTSLAGKSTSGATPSAASKKKLLSMAMQAQKQRREAALAAGVLAGSISPSRRAFDPSGAKRASSATSREAASSSDTDSSPQRRAPIGEKSNDCDDEALVVAAAASSASHHGPSTDDVGGKSGDQPTITAVQVLMRPRKASGGSYPKSLIMADSEPASLVPPASEDDETVTCSSDRRHSTVFLDSPVKLMPPADPERILSLPACDDCQGAAAAPVDCEPVAVEHVESIDDLEGDVRKLTASDDGIEDIVKEVKDEQQ
jgi:hypothetical protein